MSQSETESGMKAHTITLAGQGMVFDCPPGGTVLSAIQLTTARGGIVAGCRGGGCGVCRVQVISGEYRCDRMSRAQVTVEDERRGIVLSCKLYPCSDLTVRVLGKRGTQQ